MHRFDRSIYVRLLSANDYIPLPYLQDVTIVKVVIEQF